MPRSYLRGWMSRSLPGSKAGSISVPRMRRANSSSSVSYLTPPTRRRLASTTSERTCGLRIAKSIHIFDSPASDITSYVHPPSPPLKPTSASILRDPDPQTARKRGLRCAGAISRPTASGSSPLQPQPPATSAPGRRANMSSSRPRPSPGGTDSGHFLRVPERWVLVRQRATTDVVSAAVARLEPPGNAAASSVRRLCNDVNAQGQAADQELRALPRPG